MKHSDPPILHIRDAPRRVQREHYPCEGLMSVIAASVIVVIVASMTYATWRVIG